MKESIDFPLLIGLIVGSSYALPVCLSKHRVTSSFRVQECEKFWMRLRDNEGRKKQGTQGLIDWKFCLSHPPVFTLIFCVSTSKEHQKENIIIELRF